MDKKCGGELWELASQAIDELSKRFDPEDISTRPGPKGSKLMYVEAWKYIEHLNDKFKLFWGGKVDNVDSIKLGDSTAVIVTCNLYIRLFGTNGKLLQETYRPGVGADLVTRPENIDMHIKTALANALKKSAINFGSGLYLWSQEERENIDKQKKCLGEILDKNRDKINKFGTANGLTKEDMPTLINDVFENGIEVNGRTIKGTDKNVFLDKDQDDIVNAFIETATNITSK